MITLEQARRMIGVVQERAGELGVRIVTAVVGAEAAARVYGADPGREAGG